MNLDPNSYDVVYANASLFDSGGMHVSWGIKKFGFGEFYASLDSERQLLKFDTETLGPKRIAAIMDKVVDSSIFPRFTTTTKTVREVSREEFIALKPAGDEGYLHMPFSNEISAEDENVMICYWEMKEGEVLAAWLDTKANTYLNGESENFDFLSYVITAKKEGFGSEWLRAQMFSWEDVVKVPDTLVDTIDLTRPENVCLGQKNIEAGQTVLQGEDVHRFGSVFMQYDTQRNLLKIDAGNYSAQAVKDFFKHLVYTGVFTDFFETKKTVQVLDAKETNDLMAQKALSVPDASFQTQKEGHTFNELVWVLEKSQITDDFKGVDVHWQVNSQVLKLTLDVTQRESMDKRNDIKFEKAELISWVDTNRAEMESFEKALKRSVGTAEHFLLQAEDELGYVITFPNETEKALQALDKVDAFLLETEKLLISANVEKEHDWWKRFAQASEEAGELRDELTGNE
jgi:hypothetical protein